VACAEQNNSAVKTLNLGVCKQVGDVLAETLDVVLKKPQASPDPDGGRVLGFHMAVHVDFDDVALAQVALALSLEGTPWADLLVALEVHAGLEGEAVGTEGSRHFSLRDEGSVLCCRGLLHCSKSCETLIIA
jgi:hypothetical protein